MGYVPPNLLLPAAAVPLVHIFHEVMADQLLRVPQPLTMGKVADVHTGAFLELMDQEDLLRVFGPTLLPLFLLQAPLPCPFSFVLSPSSSSHLRRLLARALQSLAIEKTQAGRQRRSE